ncbi:MAG: ATP synthase gamma chain [Candidatus Curtissbacteria bacterium GW2011_GWA1_40_16]|uniref:ATP synthase gamma chain n=1 Tax=Candidatus Curtissbacteria bacterium GW2011_GWA1_40_16 TaxID=1618405 RepID=A0A0G0UDB3_9BACT|nr:MAG: ATP synthase gamma chain [Candidatus Curtissbacteria bacterium GW2011_GWA1_40_16]
MAQIREIRKRIKSIENTKKVTHAMELVSAAKMRKAQVWALSGRPYSTSLNEIITEVREKTDKMHTMLKPKSAPKQLIIVVASDRGLAGGLNINLFREIIAKEIKDATYITIGKKATNFAVKTGAEFIASFESEEKSPLEIARSISKLARDLFTSSQVNKVSILYPHFVNTTNQIPKWVQILPIEFEDQRPTDLPTYRSTDLLFEPDIDKILNNILPHYILTRIYQVLLEAKASEHSARMVAMKNATDAAGDLVEDLTLTYNQARQEAITKELLDIVTAQKGLV